MTPRTAYFQEDDYCRVELLPAHNLGFCQTALLQMVLNTGIPGKSPPHTTVACRPLPLVALGIDFTGVINLFSHHLPAFDRVETGYARHTVECRHIRAFGEKDTCTIFISHNETRFVDCIWFDFGLHPECQRDSILATFHSLDALGPMLFIDWVCGRLFPLHDSAQMVSYLHECAETLVELAQT